MLFKHCNTVPPNPRYTFGKGHPELQPVRRHFQIETPIHPLTDGCRPVPFDYRRNNLTINLHRLITTEAANGGDATISHLSLQIADKTFSTLGDLDPILTARLYILGTP